MLLKDICTVEAVCCKPNTTVLAVARLMRQRHVGDVIVVDDPQSDQTPIGVVTDRDIVVEVLGKELDPSKVTVREIMRTPVVVAGTSEDASQAVERMKLHGVRRIPIMDENLKLAGIVCLDDLLGRLASDAAALAEIVSHEQDRERRMRR
jgi:CBS domain-containing protein